MKKTNTKKLVIGMMALTLGTTSLVFAKSQKTAIDFFKERGRISE